MKKYIAGCLLLALTLVNAPAAHAQYNNSVSCTQQSQAAMEHEQRIERSVLYGQKASKDLPVGSTRYDKNGDSWIKKDINTWNSLAPSHSNDTFTDEQMDNAADVPVRRGIFEIRKATTSELIPPIAQTFRAFGCKLRAVCKAVLQSESADDSQETVKVQPLGCIEFQEPVFNGCKVNTQGTVSTDSCDSAVTSILDHEQALLKLAVAYDAAYRTLLQFEGVFEGFLNDFRFPLLDPLWQTVRTVGGFSKLPCFLGQCDQ